MNKSLTHWDDIKQPPDSGTAGTTWFYKSTYTKIQEGLKSLLNELKEYSNILEGMDIAASPYETQIDRLEQLISWGDNALKLPQSSITIHSISWLNLRYLKAGLLLLAKNLQAKKREELKKHKALPRSILQAYDEEIKQFLNLAESGMLLGLKPAKIFFEVTDLIREETSSNEKIGLKENDTISGEENVFASDDQLGLQIIDSELRERCLALLRKYEQEDFKEKLDTVVREMSVVLENRIKEISGFPEKYGKNLLDEAFGRDGKPPVLKFSGDKKLQNSAKLFFEGYAGFVRNEVMHKIIPTYTRERVFQLLGFVDYLLFLLSRAEINKKVVIKRGKV